MLIETQVARDARERDVPAVGAEPEAAEAAFAVRLAVQADADELGRARDQVALEDIVLTGGIVERHSGHQVTRVADEADVMAVGAEDRFSEPWLPPPRAVGARR